VGGQISTHSSITRLCEQIADSRNSARLVRPTGKETKGHVFASILVVERYDIGYKGCESGLLGSKSISSSWTLRHPVRATPLAVESRWVIPEDPALYPLC
jgi:hypothetical protein